MKRKQRRYTTTFTAKDRKESDLTGSSDFERKVYKAVLRIPRGETRSYKWVAERAGSPRAYRAVGNALNKNPSPGIIPCHRVIRSDGAIGGFSRGGVKKKWLLRKERVMV